MTTTRRFAASAAARALVALGLAFLTAATARAEEPLSFFKNYFVSGDYVVRGVSLWRAGDDGVAVGKIPPLGGRGGVPAKADLVAAFLYVQTAESVEGSGIDHATFNGIDLGPYTLDSKAPGSGTFAKPLVAWEKAPAPCWNPTSGAGRKLVTYRADVLRFLTVDAATGKHDRTAAHRITVPDAGRSLADISEGGKETKWSSAPRAIGASLVAVYRDPERPFSGIVIYDGAYTKGALDRMSQKIDGFYQSSSASPSATVTYVVGDGHQSNSERIYLDDKLIATNPFGGADGPKWDNPTFVNVPLKGDVASTTLTVDRWGASPDCASVSAIVFRTTVQDTDGDGLIDAWEKSPPPIDPTGTPLPDLASMGATPDHKDLFVQIDFMQAAEGTKYGDVAKHAHTHLPAAEALASVAQAFGAAPVGNPDKKNGIRVHLDVGDRYQGPAHIVPATRARGGKGISETLACPDPASPETGKPVECATFRPDGAVAAQADIPGQYPKHPGTVGWKTGFQLIRDELLGFDRNRKDIFHYVLFGHSVGIPREPCLNADGSADLACQASNPGFHVPRTNSGIADFPGGDVLVTLGAFDDGQQLPVGTAFMQASTLMHELGHNFELTHAGLQSLDPAVPREPNCKPLYLSTMNYLYQLRGLPDAKGGLHLDYSATDTATLDELGGLSEKAPVGGQYRLGWYAPLNNSYLAGLAQPAKKHCDGSDLKMDANGNPAEIAMVRVDAPAVGGQIDWDANGTLGASAVPLDANFNGDRTALNSSPSDWANLRLSQVGGRRTPGGFYLDAGDHFRLGPLSLDVGRGDIGRGDIGRGDIGRGDIGRGDIGRGDIGVAIGRGDIGRGDIGRGDIGRGDIGRGDIGRGDIGRGDIGRGDIGRGVFGLGDLDVGGPGEPFGEVNLETALAVAGNAPPPPSELSACLTDATGACVSDGGDGRVRLDWKPPNLGRAVGYSVYRFAAPAGAFLPAALPWGPSPRSRERAWAPGTTTPRSRGWRTSPTSSSPASRVRSRAASRASRRSRRARC